jgi:hypothetical protein
LNSGCWGRSGSGCSRWFRRFFMPCEGRFRFGAFVRTCLSLSSLRKKGAAARSVDSAFCGNSSVGRAQPCQGWGREFESRFPLRRRPGTEFRSGPLVFPSASESSEHKRIIRAQANHQTASESSDRQQIGAFPLTFVCPGRESNPHGRLWPRDFKSRVSTSSTTRARRGAKAPRDRTKLAQIGLVVSGRPST